MKKMTKPVRRFINDTERQIDALPQKQRHDMTKLVDWLKNHPHHIYVGRKLSPRRPRRTTRRIAAA